MILWGENMGSKEHKQSAPMELNFSVITLSDSLSEGERDDESGDYIVDEMMSSGHNLVDRVQIPDDKMSIIKETSRIIVDYDVDLIITTGGTGVSSQDVTVETMRKLFEKKIEGFGELFRRFSYDEIGTATVLTRASAGVIEGTVIFNLPGSLNAVKTGMDIIKPEASHIVKHLRE